MTLQQEVIRRLRCKAEINVDEEIRLTINFLKDYIKKNDFIRSLVLGISGGKILHCVESYVKWLLMN